MRKAALCKVVSAAVKGLAQCRRARALWLLEHRALVQARQVLPLARLLALLELGLKVDRPLTGRVLESLVQELLLLAQELQLAPVDMDHTGVLLSVDCHVYGALSNFLR